MTDPTLTTPAGSVPAPKKPARWRAWKIGLCLAAIFVGGVACGAVLTLQVLRHELARRADPERWTEIMLGTLDRAVHLTPAQRAELRPVIRARIDEAARVRDRALADLAGILQAGRQQVAARLSEDQRRRLDQLIERRDRLFRRWRQPPAATAPPPAPSPGPSGP